MCPNKSHGNESVVPRTEQSRLAGESGIIVAGDDGEVLDEPEGDDDGEDCACDGLPEGVPCAECFISHGATFDD